jgi:hypothetical protein
MELFITTNVRTSNPTTVPVPVAALMLAEIRLA